jgi:FkbM family methyltransferase
MTAAPPHGKAGLRELARQALLALPPVARLAARVDALQAGIGERDDALALARADVERLRQDLARAQEAGGAERERQAQQIRDGEARLSALQARFPVGGCHDSLSIFGALLRLREAGPLGGKGAMVALPFDKTMAPAVLAEAAWQPEEIAFLSSLLTRERYTLLDIGANVGLVTLQILQAQPKVSSAICIEPDAQNFACLSFNTARHGAKVVRHNVALGAEEGTAEFFRDVGNIGNYSLNADAMRGQDFERTLVTVRDAARFFAEQRSALLAAPLIWKSDTQGYDELVITRVPADIWANVQVAIVELWRIQKPGFDADAFRAKLDAFPNRRIGSGPQVTADAVMAYLGGTDYAHDDLYLWRDQP